MRTLFSLISPLWLVALAAPAVADGTRPSTAPPAARPPVVRPSPIPASELAPIDLASIPEPCATLARQATAANLTLALAARISLASCLPTARLASASLVDCEASVLEVEEAAAQSFALLDEVTTLGDPLMKIIAEHARGELLVGLSVRMQSTVPPPGRDASSIAMHHSRKAVLELLLVPWRDRARLAFEHVLELAREQPRLARNPVVRTAVRSSEQRLAAIAPPDPSLDPSSDEGRGGEPTVPDAAPPGPPPDAPPGPTPDAAPVGPDSTPPAP
ncbi:MAG: hypothetical protein ACTHU0_01595, partial [Kofleriaceae bacterium]